MLFQAALFFSILLNFKHIYLYYAPAYIVFYLAEYFCVKNTVEFLSRILKLGLTVILPFGLSFGKVSFSSYRHLFIVCFLSVEKFGIRIHFNCHLFIHT